MLNLTKLNLVHMHNTCSVDVVRKHHLSPAFFMPSSFAGQRVDFKNRRITCTPNTSAALIVTLLTDVVVLVHNSKLNLSSHVKMDWRKGSHDR